MYDSVVFRKHVVFGRVVSGMEVVKAIESSMTDTNDRPFASIGWFLLLLLLLNIFNSLAEYSYTLFVSYAPK
jgi:hypothetical protein